MNMLQVISATYCGNYTIAITFNNGTSGMANLKDSIFNDKRSVFVDLQDESYFKQFTIEHGTITWTNGLDLSPEFLFFVSFQQEAAYQAQFKQWGYS